MPRKRESSIKLPSASRDSTKKSEKKKKKEVFGAQELILRAVGYPFRMRGEPRLVGLEIDRDDLFADYAREQWLGSVVRTGMYLFDRYIMPDFAFQIVRVYPENSVVTHDTKIILENTSEAKQITSKYTLKDVVGHQDVKRKCRVILKYLQNPSQFGEWAPRAVLFHGPPGTGKTMTAKALANEADARMVYAKASDLIGVHVGDGGRRISALFDEARKNTPSIIFIDELDAIGLARSFQAIRGDVSEVVTALLGELDNVSEQEGLVLIGATNATHLIDPAIYSRFDAFFEFTLPNLQERIEILEMYAEKLPLPLEASLDHIASLTEGFSGRDLRDKLLKEALHIALSEELDNIPQSLIFTVLKKIKIRESPHYMV